MTDKDKKCVPCEGLTQPLSAADITAKLETLSGWAVDSTMQKIRKEFKFGNFTQTMEFINAIATIAEEQNHHPDVEFGYNYSIVAFTTHSIGGLSDNDFICAKAIENMLKHS
jgi:4a-hydroxytetrahydrobiopterin dehydratase